MKPKRKPKAQRNGTCPLAKKRACQMGPGDENLEATKTQAIQNPPPQKPKSRNKRTRENPKSSIKPSQNIRTPNQTTNNNPRTSTNPPEIRKIPQISKSPPKYLTLHQIPPNLKTSEKMHAKTAPFSLQGDSGHLPRYTAALRSRKGRDGRVAAQAEVVFFKSR